MGGRPGRNASTRGPGLTPSWVPALPPFRARPALSGRGFARRERLRLVLAGLWSWARQRFSGLGQFLGLAAFLELVEQLENAGPALCGLVNLDVKLRDPAQADLWSELTPNERHRPAKRGERCGPFPGLPDQAEPDPGMGQVRRRFDLGERDKSDSRIGDFASDDAADLLAKQLVDAICPLAHEVGPRTPRAALAASGPRSRTVQVRSLSPRRPPCPARPDGRPIRRGRQRRIPRVAAFGDQRTTTRVRTGSASAS
jgi:hypothetical protein